MINYFLKISHGNYFELFSEDQALLKHLNETGLIEDPICKDHKCSHCVKSNISICNNYCNQFKSENSSFRNCIRDSKINDININFVKLNVSHSLDDKKNNTNICGNSSLKCNRDSNINNFFNLNTLDINTDLDQVIQEDNNQGIEESSKDFRFKNIDKGMKRMDNILDNMHEGNHAKLLNLYDDTVDHSLKLSDK